MKRFMALLLAALMLFACTGCEDVKDQAQDYWEENEEEIKQTAWDWIQINILGWDCVLRYDANGGMGAPGYTRFKSGSKPFIAAEKPLREGYHFLGWSRVETDTESHFSSGWLASQELSQDTTLYAVWKEHDVNAVTPDHLLMEVTEENRAVQVKCRSCGMNYVNPNMTVEEFAAYKDFKKPIYSLLSEKEKAEVDRQFALYKAGAYGPAVLYFMTEAFDTEELDLGVLEELISATKKATKDLENGAVPGMKDYGQMKSFFEHIGGSVKVGAVAVGIFKVGHYASVMKNNQGNMTEEGLAFVEMMQTVTSFTPLGFYYDELFDTLGEGLKLWEDCVEHRDALLARLTVALDNSKTTNPRLNDLLGDYEKIFDYLQVNHTFTEEDPTQYDHIPTFPSALAVLAKLQETPDDWKNVNPNAENKYEALNEEEKQLVNVYLTMRLEYEVEQLDGVPIETYLEYLQD